MKPETRSEKENAPAVVGSGAVVRHLAKECQTAEQHLKGIFLHLQIAERLPEPERTEQLKRMIDVALDDLSWVKMPNTELRHGAKTHDV